MHLKSFAEKLPGGFNKTARITHNPLSGVGSSLFTILLQKHSLDLVLPLPKMLQTDPLSLHSNLLTLSDFGFVMLDEAKSSPDWPQWIEALNAKYFSLRKHNIFGPLVTNRTTKLVGFKLIFNKKRNA